MRIDWKTVGNCISRAREFLEPDVTKRLDGLVNIGIDETIYKKGHKYITVVVNHDTNEVVTGDGATWITECVNEFIPDAERCVDNFHVVEWAMEALDEVRLGMNNARVEAIEKTRFAEAFRQTGFVYGLKQV